MVTLASGEALAVGGFNLYLGYMSTAELYNPFGNYDILHEIPGTRILRHAARDVQKRYIFADDGLDIQTGIFHQVIDDTFRTDKDHCLDVPPILA